MISIIMPAYNAALYIEEAIQSVLYQTYQDWELLVIDDCSSDRTPEIIKFYIKKDSRICYVRNECNLGVADSRNKGISIASGEWIAFLDSDDSWRLDKLQKQIDYIQNLDAYFIFTGSSFMDENSRSLNYYLPVPNRITYKELLKQNIISCSSVLIRRSIIKDYPMENASYLHEDFAVWLRILRDKNIYAYGINEPLLIYRVSSNSKSGNKIKAGIMTFRVYRSIGIAIIPACYYWSYYFIRSLKKYRNLIH